jgi:autotransporter-associated beta strand protein
VGGGGTWTFSGENTSTGGSTSAALRLDLANGATLVADYGSNNATKFASAQRINFGGGNLTIKGNTSAATTVSPNSTELAGSLTAGSLGGFGSVLTTEKSGANALTVNLGTNTRATGGILSYLRVQGDGTVTTTTTLLNNVLAGVFIASDYATTNSSGVVVARPGVLAYTSLATNSGGSGTGVYSISGNFTSSIAANTNVQWYGMKINTTGAGQSYTATGNTTVNLLGTPNASLLFVGDHDYSINATTIGRLTADNRTQTILNTGSGVLTINAALATVSSNTGRILFGGPGKTVLTTGATGNAGAVGVAEGILSVSHNNALGSETASVYVQSGGTLELQNNITLNAANTLNLHGLGNGGNGALRNLGGDNVVAGNVVLGITSRMKTETGSSLRVNGAISAASGESSTLILDGGGTTTLAGAIDSTITGGLHKTGMGSATLLGANTYTGATTVSAGTLIIVKNNLTATITPADIVVAFSNTPTAGNYAILSGSLVRTSPVSVTISNTGWNGAFNTNTGVLTVTEVIKTTPEIIWSDPSAISYGTALSSTQLNASSSVPGAFVYSPTNGSVLNVGIHTLTAVFTAQNTNNYISPVTNTVTLVVNPAAPAGPTFASAYPGNAPSDLAPNGLTYLANYAFGGSSNQPAMLPVQDKSDSTKLTLVAYIRTNNTSGTLSVKGEKGSSLTNWDLPLIDGEVATDQSGAPTGTQKQIFTTPNSGPRLFLRLKATYTP